MVYLDFWAKTYKTRRNHSESHSSGFTVFWQNKACGRFATDKRAKITICERRDEGHHRNRDMFKHLNEWKRQKTMRMMSQVHVCWLCSLLLWSYSPWCQRRSSRVNSQECDPKTSFDLLTTSALKLKRGPSRGNRHDMKKYHGKIKDALKSAKC